MKKIYLSILSSMLFAMSFATIHTVTNIGQTFNPDSISIGVGDSVDFTIAASHDVFQYEQPKFNNTSFSSGDATQNGFTLPAGGGIISDHVAFMIPGTYYYVCSPHFANGMKGIINVAHGAPVASCSEPFFSQYMEGSGSNKAIEIYNPTTSAIDLSLYSVIFYNNGGNQINTLSLSGMLAADGTYVISNSGSDVAGIADLISGIINHNGDDAYALVKNGVGAVDIIGVFDNDPGSSFMVTGGSTANNTLTRMSNINAGNTDWSSAMNEWNVTASNDTVGFGSHTMNPCLVGPVISFKTDSFTFNEGDGTIHLDTLLINPAIASPVAESFEIHLDAASTASAADFNLTVTAPVTLPFTYDFSLPFIPNFTAQPLDATLVDDALIEGTEWFRIVLRNGMNGLNIGSDSVLFVQINDNDFPADTFVEMTSNMATVSEADGTYSLDIDYQQLSSNANHTVDVQMISGDAADIGSFTTQTISFSSISESASITITDDALVEDNDTIMFALVNATNGLMIGPDSIFTLIIEDNDVASFTLDLIEGNDGTGGSSTGLHGKFTGIVNSLDRGFNALEFSIQDANGSVDVYSNVAPFSSMSVAVGDEVEIEGDVTFFNGMVRIENLVSLTTLGTGNTLTPVVVTEVNDDNESDLIRMNGLTLVDPAQWIAAGGAGFDVQALDGAGDTVNIRIDRDYDDLYNSMAPNSPIFDLIGIASQYDADPAYVDNHQILPRDLNDVILYPSIGMSDQGTTVNEDAGTVTINFSVANYVSGSYTVDVDLGNTTGSAADIDNFTMMTGVAVTGGVGSFDVVVTDDMEIETNEGFEFVLMNPSTGLLLGTNNKFELTVVDNDANAIDEINVNDLKLYPNPSSDMLTLELVSNESQISTITIIDVLGRIVLTDSYILNRGNNAISINVSDLVKGTYSLEIATEAGKHVESLQVK